LPQGPHPWIFWTSIVTFTENWFKLFIEPLGYNLSIYWGVLWSLAIEEQFYLLYPWVLKSLRNRSRMVVFLIGVITAGILSTTIASLFWHKYPIVVFNPATDHNSLAGFGLIAVGCLLYLAVEKFGLLVAATPRLTWSLSLAGALLMGTIYWHITVAIDFWWMALGRTLIGIGLALFLLGAMHWKGWENPFLKGLSLPGKFSYGGYLYHALVLFCLSGLLLGMYPWEAFSIFAVATTLVSGFSFYWFEMPTNTFIRKLFARS
jgi:peptidoglycan/LPS O-acetylase OafA/YrhL